MVLLSDELYELIMDNIEDKKVRERIFAERIKITDSDRDGLCGALETDIDYWTQCIRKRPNEKEEILQHVRHFIERDERFIEIFHL